MNNKKTEKQKKAFKEFVEKHGPAILMMVGAGLTCGVYGTYCYRKGLHNGGILGFNCTIDWFDKHFDDLKLRELWEGWMKENPDKVITAKLK